MKSLAAVMSERGRIIERLMEAKRRGLIGTIWVQDLFVRVHPVSPYEHSQENARVLRWDRVDSYLERLGA